MQILVLNAGSSSIKFKLFDMKDQNELAGGLLERIGSAGGCLTQHWKDSATGEDQKTKQEAYCATHKDALELIMHGLQTTGMLRNKEELAAVGHRVVHGGEAFHEPVIVDNAILETIRDMIPLAPLHNPANLEGIEVAKQLLPDVPQIAVFDTAFHQTMPEVAYRYAIADELYQEKHVRRYGFHGTSHHYVAKQAAIILGRPLSTLKLISMHLGNGCSISAIQNGRCIDTSMGMTPLEGLVMGTRSGDVDPALHFYLQREAGYSCEDLEGLLNKESGLKGLCGVADMRQVQELADQGNEAAKLAEEIFVYRIRKYLGSYFAVLGGLEAIIFTGGIGENSVRIRKKVCDGLEHMGVSFDGQSSVATLVIPTNEELEIAINAENLVSGHTAPGADLKAG